MRTNNYPDSVVIGRIVVYTPNRFLAREIERLVEQERLPERMSAGMKRLDGENIHWVVLPSPAAQESRHLAVVAA